MIRKSVLLAALVLSGGNLAYADNSGVHLFDDQDASGISDPPELAAQSAVESTEPSQFTPTGEDEPVAEDSDGSNTETESE